MSFDKEALKLNLASSVGTAGASVAIDLLLRDRSFDDELKKEAVISAGSAFAGNLAAPGFIGIFSPQAVGLSAILFAIGMKSTGSQRGFLGLALQQAAGMTAGSIGGMYGYAWLTSNVSGPNTTQLQPVGYNIAPVTGLSLTTGNDLNKVKTLTIKGETSEGDNLSYEK